LLFFKGIKLITEEPVDKELEVDIFKSGTIGKGTLSVIKV
jgi:hypothetical protein